MNYAALIKAIQSASSHLQGRVAAAANQALILRNWVVGAYLVDFEQNGKERAKYGERLLENVAADLRAKNTSGLNVTQLRLCRQVYTTYPQIHPTVSGELAALPAAPKNPIAIRPTLSD